MVELIQQYWPYVTLVMVIASFVVNFTKNDVDNKYYALVLKILNAVAGNFNVKGILNK